MKRKSYNSVKLKEAYDVIIAGAGPSGCMAACYLDKNLEVLLIDSLSLPRDKSCGGAINHYSWEIIKNFNPPEDIFTSPKTVNFRYVDFEKMVFKPTKLKFKNALRYDFDAWLLSLVPENVTVSGKTSLQDIREGNDEVKLILKQKEKTLTIKSRYFIDATGANSKSRALLTNLEREYYITVQSWAEPTREPEPYFDCVILNYTGKKLAYSYIMPKGEFVLVGSVFYPHTNHAVKTHKELIKILNEKFKFIGKIAKSEGGRALKIATKCDLFLGKGNILVSGEAAGFISPTSGEGISYALSSGICAAQAINEAIKNKENALYLYQQKTKDICKNITSKVKKLTLIDTPFAKALVKFMPTKILSKITMKL